MSDGTSAQLIRVVENQQWEAAIIVTGFHLDRL